MHDPQPLSTLGKARALLALGRIPLASEVPMWTLLGCVLAHRLYPSYPYAPEVSVALSAGAGAGTDADATPFDWVVVLQCMLVTWGTNISINYANEYFDWDLDRPGQVRAIEKEVARRRALEEAEEERQRQRQRKGHGEGDGKQEKRTASLDSVTSLPHLPGTGREPLGSVEESDSSGASTPLRVKAQLNDKIMGNTTRIIHDGTFPPYTALVLGALAQLSLVLLVLLSRSADASLALAPHSHSNAHSHHYARSHTSSALTTGTGTPYKGVALAIGIISTVLSHEYIAPPLRFHYHGWGELTSAVLLSPASVLWGMTGYYTATHHPLTLGSLIPSLSIPPTTLALAPGARAAQYAFHLDLPLVLFLLAIFLLEQARILIMHIPDIPADTAGAKRTLCVRLGHRAAAWLYVGLNGAGIACVLVLLRLLLSRKGGELGRIAGSGGYRMMAGWSLVGMVGLSMMLLTTISLFAHAPDVGVHVRENLQGDDATRVATDNGAIYEKDPNVSGRTEAEGTQAKKGGEGDGRAGGWVLPLTEPPKLVSLQVLLTPLLLAGSLVFF